MRIFVRWIGPVFGAILMLPGIGLGQVSDARTVDQDSALTAAIETDEAERLLERAIETTNKQDFAGARNALQSIIKRYDADEAEHELVKAFVLLGDVERLGFQDAKDKAKIAYMKADVLFRTGEIPADSTLRRQLDKEARATKKERRRRAEEIRKKKRRPESRCKKKNSTPTGALVGNQVGENFGYKGMGLRATGKGVIDSREMRRLRVGLIFAARARYELAMYAVRTYRQIEMPKYVPAEKPSPEIKRWWKKKICAEGIRKEREELERLETMAMAGPASEKQASREIWIIEQTPAFDYWLETGFLPWREEKDDALGESTRALSKVAELHVPEWEITAAARVGDVYFEFYQDLASAPRSPSWVANAEWIGLYLHHESAWAEIHRDTAESAYRRCIEIASSTRWYDDTVQHCKTQLNKIDPRSFSPVHEIAPKPTFPASDR